MNFEADAKLFEDRNHFWDDIVEEYKHVPLKDYFIWNKKYY